jgi:signal transduction histidine kinase
VLTSRALTERPTLARRFELERRALLVARAATACRLAIFLVPLFGVLDVILHPHALGPVLLIRLAMVIAAAAALFALQREAGRRHAATLSLLLVWALGGGIVLMTTFVGGGSSPYYAGISLVMLAAAVLLPWDAGTSAATAAVLIGLYVVACLGWGGVPEPRLFAANLFFLGSTALITVVSHRAGAAARRREFLQRVALEEAGKHRDEFLANITHELRTPLAAILGFSEMLTDYLAGAPREQRSWLRRIRENASTLYRLIVQLLDFSRIEAGALRLEREPVDLAAIVTKVAADMRAIAGDAGIAVTVDIDRDHPPVVGDPARVEEIVTNLASNALKFSGGQPITLALRPGGLEREPPWHRVVPEPDREAAAARFVEVAVIDRGEGIALEDLHRLFVAFQQLDGSSTRRQGGTGLGLAISARLAEAMRGHIAVRSVSGTGSTFALLLPAAA